MLRIVRLRERRAAGLRGLTLIAVALAAGGCSAGFDRFELGSMNFNGGPSPSSRTGTLAPMPSEPMYQPSYQERAAPPPSDYRRDSRPDYRSDAAPPPARGPYMTDRGAGPQQSDRSVRMAGLPEAYDRSPPSAAPRPSRPAPYEASRASPPPTTAPVPPRAAYEAPSDAASGPGATIEVKPGDTLFGLSKTHKVSIAELMRANNMQNAELRVGQKLVVPSGQERTRRVASLPSAQAPMPAPQAAPRALERSSTPAPAMTAPRALERSTAPAVDPSAGPIVPPLAESPPPASPPIADAPSASPAPAASPRSASADDSGWTGSHTVARGDSLYGIARKYGVRLNDLERANNITNPRASKPGTVLKVPQGGEASRTARAAPTPSAPEARAHETPSVAQEAGTPAQPTIINSRTRVAALGRDTTDAPVEAAPQSEAAAPSAKPETPTREAAAGHSAAVATGKFRWPARGKVITGFGGQPGGVQNEGINISLPRGTDIHAAESGVVTYASDGVQGYGNLVLIRHQDGWITAYAHNDQILVKSGETVRRGQVIAKAGATGSVSQPQLHFEIRQGAKPVDPMQHLER